MKKQLILSLSMVAIAAAIIVGGTIAYFSDTETSSGNAFAAGSLDLKIDSTCHYNGMICQGGIWVEETLNSSTFKELVGQPCTCTWSAKDLDNEVFFNYGDVKPGDVGENTVSLHINDNDAWVCAQIANLANDDNGCNEPEGKVDQTCGLNEGELADNLLFTIWLDNGDGDGVA